MLISTNCNKLNSCISIISSVSENTLQKMYAGRVHLGQTSDNSEIAETLSVNKLSTIYVK